LRKEDKMPSYICLILIWRVVRLSRPLRTLGALSFPTRSRFLQRRWKGWDKITLSCPRDFAASGVASALTISSLWPATSNSGSRADAVRQGKTRRNCFWKNESSPAFWQKRYYDFNAYSERKHIEKLRYRHRNPVKRGLVTSPELWRWSSFRHYWYGEKELVRIG
jgi:hypothetical protein